MMGAMFNTPFSETDFLDPFLTPSSFSVGMHRIAVTGLTCYILVLLVAKREWRT